MTHEFVSVNGLGGAMELGFVQNGFDLMHRTGSLDLGAPLVEGNRKLMGWKWEANLTDNQRTWDRSSPAIVIGNPPCSAFSTLTRKDLRGDSAKVLQFTREMVDYPLLQKTPPLLIAIESVQQAFSTGRKFFQSERERLEEGTGHKYDLVWLMHSNASLGGASTRKRVFVVYTRMPFGVEYAQPTRVARFGDCVRDLEGLALTPHKQGYRRPPTWWSSARRATDGVDGHFNSKKANDQFSALMDIAASIGKPWMPNEPLEDVLRRVHGAGRTRPHEWNRNLDKLVQKNFQLGMNQTSMWDPEKQGRVVTGTGPYMSVHYAEHRMLTYRECARLQGFPDTWRIWPARDYNKLGASWGKGVPVDAGRWLGNWVKEALEGTPGTVQGEIIGDRERKVDITQAFKHTLRYERVWDHSRNTVHEQQGLAGVE